jgi:transcription elongation GreA/GreB family factor
MSYEECKICRKVKANPLHVKAAHMMTWNEYKTMTNDPEFMQEVADHRDEREEREAKEYNLSRLLLYHWFPKTTTLTGIMRRYTEHAKGSKEVFVGSRVDLSQFDGKDDAIVDTVEVAEAMTKEGWECVTGRGGQGGTKKEYVMRRL